MNTKFVRASFFSCLGVAIAVLRVVGGGEAANAAVGDTGVAVWKDNARAAWSMTLDDNRPSQIYVVAPALTSRGLHGTFYVNPSETSYGWNLLKDVGDINHDGRPDGYLHLPAQGHELGSHTMNHLSVVPGLQNPGAPGAVFPSYQAFHDDNILVKQKIQSLTGQEVVSFAYPFGYWDVPSRDIARLDYLSARDLGLVRPQGNGHYLANPATPADMAAIHCFYTEGNQPWGDWRNYDWANYLYDLMLDDTIAQGGWGVEFFHNTGYDWQNFYSDWGAVNQQAYFEHLNDVVNRVDSGDIWQETVGKVVRYINSRKRATITMGEIAADSISLQVDDNLDDSLFNVPLTINTVIPPSWVNHLNITHNGQPVDFTIGRNSQLNTTFATYNVIADGGLISLLYNPFGGPGSPPIPGDYNVDGKVDSLDFILWRNTLNSTVKLAADGDFDGVIDQDDYFIWRANFGNVAPGFSASNSVTSVPEPNSLLLALLADIAIVAESRRRLHRAC